MKSLFILLGLACAMNASATTPVVYHTPAQVAMPSMNMGSGSQAIPSSSMPTMSNDMSTMDHHISSQTQLARSTSKTLIVQHGQNTVTVKLDANATTGYQWLLGDYDHNLLTLLGYTYQAPQTQRIGAGGQAVFTFHVNSALFTGPQVAKLMFHYVRPWQYSDPGQTQIVNVVSISSSVGHLVQHVMTSQTGLTTHSTVAHPYTPPMQTTNALAVQSQSSMRAPLTTMPHMHNTAAPVHSKNTHQQNHTWLSLPAAHQSTQ